MDRNSNGNDYILNPTNGSQIDSTMNNNLYKKGTKDISRKLTCELRPLCIRLKLQDAALTLRCRNQLHIHLSTYA